MSRMLQEYLVYETPWCTDNRAYLTTTQSLALVEVRALRGFSPWLAMLQGRPDLHDGRRSAQSSTNGWASNRPNLHERPVQLNLHERLRTLDLRVLHSPCHRRGVYDGAFYLRGRPGAVTDVYGGLCGISLWCLSLRARAEWRS